MKNISPLYIFTFVDLLFHHSFRKLNITVYSRRKDLVCSNCPWVSNDISDFKLNFQLFLVYWWEHLLDHRVMVTMPKICKNPEK